MNESEPPLKKRRIITPLLKKMRVGEITRFAPGYSVNSIRQSAYQMGIRVSYEVMDDGTIRIERVE